MKHKKKKDINCEYDDLLDKSTSDSADITEENTENIVTQESDNVEIPDKPEEPEEPEELAKIKAQCDEYVDRLQRLAAEYDNYRKRTTKERIATYDNGVADTIEKLLPVVDNFERALESVTNKDDPFYIGVDMIMRQIIEIFASMSVEEIPALNQKFDPNIHFAVAHEDDSEKGENVISTVMQKGYKYKDKVIRHSMVKVVN